MGKMLQCAQWAGSASGQDPQEVVPGPKSFLSSAPSPGNTQDKSPSSRGLRSIGVTVYAGVKIPGAPVSATDLRIEVCKGTQILTPQEL